jgi:hypothetical protein
MKLSSRLSLEDTTRVLALVAAVASVGKFFYDRAERNAQLASERSVEYIESYADDPMISAREQLYSFWAGEPRLIAVFQNEALSTRQYSALLSATIFRADLDLGIRQPLLLLDSFYSQITFCLNAELCDKEILQSYFCRNAQQSAKAYAPFYKRLANQTGDPGLGTDLQVFASGCDISTESLLTQ